MEFACNTKTIGRGRGRAKLLFLVRNSQNLGKNVGSTKSREQDNNNKNNVNIKDLPCPDQFRDTVNSWKLRITTEHSRECICKREIVELRCENCTKIFKGRPHLACELHKNVIHLMDYRNCPHCHEEI
ncbi:uncharacterized protein CG13380-like [Hydractinia symbiolongicarpus]|uniref:uncharacterized protein CG13380-like n=1 Tax=Hydractinia symbiolongicarpus TaxID=13093 RepID=UPI0025506521|nr:uncharacterized protein CG13380-like [Hydractinia symbiolongicarpus]